jgi:hypothetical protein
VGRDIAQLIFCIHCYFPIEEYLTPVIVGAVRSWMTILWSGGLVDILNGFTKSGRPLRVPRPEYHTGIYDFLRRSDVDVILCDPLRIFKTCHDLNSEL